jgi:hypothetical protein
MTNNNRGNVREVFNDISGGKTMAVDNTRITPASMNMNAGRQMDSQVRSGAGRNMNGAQGINGSMSGASGASEAQNVSVRNAGNLGPGSTVSGQITDLTNNKITVTLSDNTSITGFIEDAPDYSIGQNGQFQIIADKDGNIGVKPVNISKGEQTGAAIINRALSDSGFPLTAKNQNAVRALMDNMMPINRDSIQKLLVQSQQYGTDDLQSLAIMNRNNFTINKETVRQFSAYRNDNYQLMNKINALTDTVNNMLMDMVSAGKSQQAANIGEALISLFTEENKASYQTGNMPSGSGNIPPEGTVGQLSASERNDLLSILKGVEMTPEQEEGLGSGNMGLREALLLIRKGAVDGTLSINNKIPAEDILEKLNQIQQEMSTGDPSLKRSDIKDLIRQMRLLSQAEAASDAEGQADGTGSYDSKAGAQNISKEGVQLILNGDPDQKDDAYSAKGALVSENGPNGAITGQEESDQGAGASFLRNMFKNISGVAKASVNSLNGLMNSGITDNGSRTAAGHTQASPQMPSVIDSMMSAALKNSRDNDAVFSLLSGAERKDLADIIKSLKPGDPGLLQLSDEALKGDISTADLLSQLKGNLSSNQNAAADLIRSPSFHKLLGSLMQSQMTLTADDLSNGKTPDSLYDNISDKLAKMNDLMSGMSSDQSGSSLMNQQRDMQSNIDFMKMINDQVAFFQLPLKLQNNSVHGDLYVYTDKKKLKANPESMSVLLHLEFENLGRMDIKIKKDYNDVKALFMIEDQDSIKLIEKNKDLLVQHLNENGYACSVRVDELEKNDEENPVHAFMNAKVDVVKPSEIRRFSFDIRA